MIVNSHSRSLTHILLLLLFNISKPKNFSSQTFPFNSVCVWLADCLHMNMFLLHSLLVWFSCHYLFFRLQFSFKHFILIFCSIFFFLHQKISSVRMVLWLSFTMCFRVNLPLWYEHVCSRNSNWYLCVYVVCLLFLLSLFTIEVTYNLVWLIKCTSFAFCSFLFALRYYLNLAFDLLCDCEYNNTVTAAVFAILNIFELVMVNFHYGTIFCACFFVIAKILCALCADTFLVCISHSLCARMLFKQISILFGSFSKTERGLDARNHCFLYLEFQRTIKKK